MNRQMFYNLPIRYKLFLSYSIVFILLISLVSVSIYYFVRKTIENNIESELQNSTTTILNTVNTSTSVSIKNYLRAAAETNRKIAEYFHQQAQQGNLTEIAAQALTRNVMLSQSIGTSGYIYCLYSTGVVAIHPEKGMLNVDVSDYEFARRQKSEKEGYFEYDWRNPREEHARPKAVYWTYFEPWDWIISASSYRSEFGELVNVDDFRENVLSLKFGKTGYSYVTDTMGNTIIHPKREGINIYEEKDVPHEFFSEMVKKKNGKIIYEWRNPGENRLRKKLVIFNFIPEYKWMIASSSYLEEFYAPLKSLRNIILISVIVSLSLALSITIRISSFITDPLQELIKRFASGASGDFSVRMKSFGDSDDEIGRLKRYFNIFMQTLETYSQDLKQEIHERRQAEEALRESEEKYRSFMEAVPDPVIVYDMDGKASYLNPAFTEIFGWSQTDCLGKKTDFYVPEENWPETSDMIEQIRSGKSFSGIETQRYTKSGDLIQVSISGAAYRTRGARLSGNVIILRDVTEAKQLEKQIIEIGDKERQSVGQDLHDDLCPHLIGIESLCKAMEIKLTEKHHEEAKRAIMITNLISEAIEMTRRLSRGLCPVHLVAHGLESSLKELMANSEKISNIACIFTSENEVFIDSNTVATHLFQIAQESVTNAVKHSEANTISVSLRRDADRVLLRISDNGKGYSQQHESRGMGMRIMRYRAKIIGAKIEIRSRPNEGTFVQVSL